MTDYNAPVLPTVLDTKQSAKIQTQDFWLQVCGFLYYIIAQCSCFKSCTLSSPKLLRPTRQAQQTMAVTSQLSWQKSQDCGINSQLVFNQPHFCIVSFFHIEI